MIQCVASTIMKLDTSTKVENIERMKRQEEGAQIPGGKDEFTPQRIGEWNLTAVRAKTMRVRQSEGWGERSRDALAGN